jgi:hypothetical protein
LIFLRKLVVDVDRMGKKVVINILMDPTMYPPILVLGVERKNSEKTTEETKRKKFICRF